MPKPVIVAGLVATSLLASVIAVGAQSLADIARTEQERRKTIKATSKVYTNGDLGKGGDVSGAAPAAGASQNPVPQPSAEAKASPTPAEPPAAAAAPDEKYWRTRMAGARTELQRNQAFHDALQSQINGLYTEFVNMGDPAKRAVIEKKRLAAIAEQDRLKAEIAKQTKAIAEIEDEARRAGAPAGWLR